MAVEIDVGKFFDEQEKIAQGKNFLEAFDQLKNSENEEDFSKNYEKVKELSIGLGDVQAEDANDLKEARDILKNLEDESSKSTIDNISKDFLDSKISNNQFEKNEYNASGIKYSSFMQMIGKISDPNNPSEIEITTEETNKNSLNSLQTGNTPLKKENPNMSNAPNNPPADKTPIDTMKNNLARHILKVAGLSDGQIGHIINGVPKSKANAAIMSRVDTLLKNVGVKKENLDAINPEKSLANVKDEDLRGEVERQAKELIAQTGRADSWSLDKQDMRGRDELHQKYTGKANEMDGSTFDKNLTKALKYEADKDNGDAKSNAWKTIPRWLDSFRAKDDKPLFTPMQTALIGLVALAVLFPPAGAIFCALCFGKALKNGIYDDSRLQKWMNENWFVSEPTPEKLNSEALDKINVKGLFEGKDKTQDKGVGEERGVEQDKVLTRNDGKNTEINGDKVDILQGQDKRNTLEDVPNIANMSWQPKGKIEDMQNLLDRKSTQTGMDPSIVNGQSGQDKSTQTGPTVKDTGIEVSKGVDSLQDDQRREFDKIVGEIKKNLPKGKAMDDLDLMQAKNRLNLEKKRQDNGR